MSCLKTLWWLPNFNRAKLSLLGMSELVLAYPVTFISCHAAFLPTSALPPVRSLSHALRLWESFLLPSLRWEILLHGFLSAYTSCWVCQECKALTILYLCHFSGLCLQWTIFRDKVVSPSGTASRLAYGLLWNSRFPKLSVSRLQHKPIYACGIVLVDLGDKGNW